MSRIGKLPIEIPQGVEIKISETNEVTVKGKLGELSQKVDPNITVKVEDNQVVLDRASESKDHKSKHGLYRAIIANMVKGVSEGYKITLELVGIGYRANVNGQLLELSLGFSHGVYMEMPPEIKVEAVSERGKNPKIILESYDKQLLGMIASKIRSLRKPEPYKGKGVKYEGEYIRRKAGKAAAEK